MKKEVLSYKIFLILGLLVIAVAVYYFVYFQYSQRGFLQVDFLNVGQGDAALISTPDSKKILIDAGPDLTILSKLNRYFSFFDRRIDLMILTHSDADHITGAIDILKRYDVGAILFNGTKNNSVYYQELLKTVFQKQIPIYVAYSGQVVKMGDGVVFKIFSPLENLFAKRVKDENFSSIVGKLIFVKNSFLFMADAPQKLEQKLLALDLSSDVLKVSHHGSKTGSSFDFLRKVNPAFSIISVEKKNKYGHPHQEVLERLNNIGTKILRTDLFGDIQIQSNGNNLLLTCEMNC